MALEIDRQRRSADLARNLEFVRLPAVGTGSVPAKRPGTGGFRRVRSWTSVCREAGGGAEGNRTPDLRIANATLSQLSYGPVRHGPQW